MEAQQKKTRVRPGSHARNVHRSNLVGPWLYACVAAFLVCMTLAVLAVAGVVPVWSGLAFVPLMYLTFKVWDKETEASNDSWGAGARAERLVGEELERLHEAGFHVFHDLHSGGSEEGNIDHLLIGREGVFVVETKGWQGIITAGKNREGKTELQRNGRWLRYCNPLSQARWGAARASDLIGDTAGRKPYVTPVVCFSRADVRLYGKASGVEVADIGALKRVMLQGRRQRYTGEQVAEMALSVSRRIGHEPSAAPGVPPEKPSRRTRFFHWLSNLPSLYLSFGFVFLLSLAFPGQFSEVFGAFSGLYKVLSDLYGYFLF